MTFQFCARWGAALLVCALAACGGGSGGAKVRTALPTLSQDSNPSGPRIDVASRNYFPAAAGDMWTYDRQESGVAARPLTRVVSAGSGGDVVISETALGSTDSTTYRRTAEGIVAVAPLDAQDAPPAAASAMANLLEYPLPFYPVGSTRTVVRQGDWGADQDGDGVNESFRFEFTQVLVEVDSLAVSGTVLASVAHFRNVTKLTLQYSNPSRQTTSVVGTEETWWAPGMGLVRATRAIVNQAGAAVETPYTLVLTAGVVGGQVLAVPQADGVLQRIDLLHNALVYDAARSRYYASVPGSVVGRGNSIAILDATTGSVSYSAAVGSEPSALALSADGSALYVGLNGSGDVLKLSLPDLTEVARVRLPSVVSSGQLFAEQIAVSPLDADVVAVSMFRVNVSPRHAGVALIRNGVLQPTTTQAHTGSNLIAFDANGQYVYGFNNETTEFGLRRLAVLANGLQEVQVVTAVGANFGTRTLDWSDHGLVLDRGVYRAPDLLLLGQASAPTSGCRTASAANRLVCMGSPPFTNGPSTLAVVDASSFVLLSTPHYQSTSTSDQLMEVVPGPSGQVALRMSTASSGFSTNAIWLFKSSAVP